MKDSRYFKDEEFRRCSPACSIEDMEEETLFVLDNVRHEAGIPLVLNSAYRSVVYEKAKGRSGNSAHTKGLAVDIRCTTSANRWKIVQAAIKCGVRRIGIGKTYIHLDTDTSLPQDVIWHYYD